MKEEQVLHLEQDPHCAIFEREPWRESFQRWSHIEDLQVFEHIEQEEYLVLILEKNVHFVFETPIPATEGKQWAYPTKLWVTRERTYLGENLKFSKSLKQFSLGISVEFHRFGPPYLGESDTK